MSDQRDDLPEPERDPQLRRALADTFGETPRDVDWAALARRTREAAAFRLRARGRRAPWWETAGKWSRRLLPVGALAAAAALVLAVLTPRASDAPAAQSTDTVSAVVSSATPAQAARQVVAASYDEGWLWSAAAGATEDQQ